MSDTNAVTKTSPSTARILIAGQEANDRQSLRDALTRIGYDVIAEASSGSQAVDLASRLQPDIVLVDAEMDSMSGLEAAGKIIKSDIAPVVLTAGTDSDLAAIARELKIAGCLVRPVREEDLLPAVEIALARHADLRWLRERVAELEDALETRKVVERAKGILMDLHGLSEADAFRRMRKTSMDNRKTMREVAEAILLSHDLQLGSDVI